jgi:hypothetical protein
MVAGKPVALTDIRVPIFAVGTLLDLSVAFGVVRFL